MSNNDNDQPVRVTGQERRHPALRILARACISIAREQLEREGQTDTDENPAGHEPKPGEAKEGEV